MDGGRADRLGRGCGRRAARLVAQAEQRGNWDESQTGWEAGRDTALRTSAIFLQFFALNYPAILSLDVFRLEARGSGPLSGVTLGHRVAPVGVVQGSHLGLEVQDSTFRSVQDTFRRSKVCSSHYGVF